MTDADLQRLVDTFYARVRQDDRIGPVFNAAVDDWPEHLERLGAFWSSVMRTTGRYKGSPLAAHMPHAQAIEPRMFDRWLELFRETVRQRFAGERADHIVRCAEDMANVIHSKVHAIPDPCLDPERITPEQRSRYAAYRRDQSDAG